MAGDVLRRHVFHCSSMTDHIKQKPVAFGLFLFFAFCLVGLRFLFFAQTPSDCLYPFDIFWVVNDALNIILFSFFCYFLYLHRIAVESQGRYCVNYIFENITSLDNCINEIRKFFHEYTKLRNVVLPWFRLILFSSSCGVTAFLTWNYNSVPELALDPATGLALDPATITPTFWSNEQTEDVGLCSFTCNKVPFLIERENARLLVNALVLCRNIMVAGFAFAVVYGMDLKHVWDSFRMRLLFIYSEENEAYLQKLIQFIDTLHPEDKLDFSIVIPIMGLATGILGNEHLR